MDGKYTDWGAYSDCSEKCGGGVKTRTRSCTNPTPAHGGKACVGPSIQTDSCNLHPCPGIYDPSILIFHLLSMFNPLQAGVAFLYPLKTSENL